MNDEKNSAVKSFSERREAVRAANAEFGLASPNAYKNGQISDLENDSVWDNFDRYFKFFN